MSRADEFHAMTMHCVVCAGPIPPDRPKLAVTCSKECTKARKDYWRSKQDARVCRYCMKPSTPEQRLAFQQWRRRPQDAEEEERYRLWKASESMTERVKNRKETLSKRKTETEPPQEGTDAAQLD